VMKINTETRRIMASAELAKRFETLGMVPDKSLAANEINGYVKSEIAKWGKVIKDAGVKPAD